MENKKEFSTEKINAFLNKINEKIQNDNTDILGEENKNVLKNWINETNPNNNQTITVEINKDIYNKNIAQQNEQFSNQIANNIPPSNENALNPEGLTKENFNEKFKEKLNILLLEETSIPKKEELITLTDNYYLTHTNIKNKIFGIAEMEQLLISLINIPKPEIEVSDINNDNNKTSPYSNSIMISLTLISILLKRIITFNVIYPNNNEEFPLIKNYFEVLINKFPELIQYNDFRIRTGLLTSIGNLTSYMLMNKMEKELISIINICTDEIFIVVKQTSEKLRTKIAQNVENGQNFINEVNTNINSNNSGHLTLDVSKTLFIEMINRLPLDENQFVNIQNLLIEKWKKFIELIKSDENNDLFPILFLSYEIITTYFRMPFFVLYFKKNLSEIMSELLPRCAKHISLTSPRIRFWSINLLISINSFYNLKNEKIFMKEILPHICLNRYLQVEGVKKNTMVLWKQITEMGGIEYIKENYEDFLKCYLNELHGHGMIEREAGCRCVQELIMKVYDEKLHKNIVNKYAKEMLELIMNCCHDACWNVRECGLISLGYVYDNIKDIINNFGENIINDINTLIKLHCFDNVIEVRDAAAYALKIYISKGGNVPENYINFYLNIIKSLNDYEKNKEYMDDTKKEIFSYITDKQDFGFLRPLDEQDFTDGINHIIKEVSSLKENNFIDKEINKDDILMIVIDNLCKNYNIGLSNLNKKTIWETLTVLFLRVEKYDVEMYLDYIVDILIKELDLNLNSLCGYQALKFVEGLIAGGVSKRTIKGKVKNKIKGRPNLVQLFDKTLK